MIQFATTDRQEFFVPFERLLRCWFFFCIVDF